MVKHDVRVFSSLEEMSWAAACAFEDLARLKFVEGKTFYAALSGGLTPRLLYQILAGRALLGRIEWKNVQLFQVDERCVPPDHPDSNYRMIREALLESGDIPPENFHRMQAERTDLEQAAEDYAHELARVLEPCDGQRPRLDIVFLGMGPDGHTASLFPGTAALEEQNVWVRPNYVERLGMRRLTMTLPLLNAAAHVIFMVAGADKAETLRKVLEGPPGELPAQRIQPLDGSLSWFLDEAAARKLSPASRGEP
ncbi:MAG TPA: 6-phosphogluconolactonase [Terriglobia bacterium]|nr:6-phosphogluconolactonase [Terriglobia bacterium]